MSFTYVIQHWEWFVLIAGTWAVYKFQHFIPSGKIDGLGIHGEYKSLNEARVQTYRKVSDEYPTHEVVIEDGNDSDGPYFIVKVLADITKSICEFLFLPIPPNKL